MKKKDIFKRLYKDYTKKYLDKIILSSGFSILVAGSTSAIAWLLDPAIKKIFIEKDQSLLLILFLIGGYYMKFNNIYYFLTIIPFLHLFFYQIRIFKSKDPKSCLKMFKSNNVFGLIIFLNLLIIKNL